MKKLLKLFIFIIILIFINSCIFIEAGIIIADYDKIVSLLSDTKTFVKTVNQEAKLPTITATENLQEILLNSQYTLAIKPDNSENYILLKNFNPSTTPLTSDAKLYVYNTKTNKPLILSDNFSIQENINLNITSGSLDPSATAISKYENVKLGVSTHGLIESNTSKATIKINLRASDIGPDGSLRYLFDLGTSKFDIRTQINLISFNLENIKFNPQQMNFFFKYDYDSSYGLKNVNIENFKAELNINEFSTPLILVNRVLSFNSSNEFSVNLGSLNHIMYNVTKEMLNYFTFNLRETNLTFFFENNKGDTFSIEKKPNATHIIMKYKGKVVPFTNQLSITSIADLIENNLETKNFLTLLLLKALRQM